MLLFLNVHDVIVWASVALAGAASSGVFAATMLWNAEFMTLTGAVTGMFLAGGSFGGMSGSSLAGFAFEHFSYMWVVYLSFIAVLCHIIVFTFSKILEQKFRMKPGRS